MFLPRFLREAMHINMQEVRIEKDLFFSFPT